MSKPFALKKNVMYFSSDSESENEYGNSKEDLDSYNSLSEQINSLGIAPTASLTSISSTEAMKSSVNLSLPARKNEESSLYCKERAQLPVSDANSPETSVKEQNEQLLNRSQKEFDEIDSKESIH